MNFRNEDRFKIRIRINEHVILLVILLLPFIQQRTMQEFPGWLISMYRIGTLLSSLYIYIVAFKKKSLLIVENKHWLFLLFWFIYMFSTVINYRSAIRYVFYNAFILYALSLLIYIEVKRNVRDLLNALSFIYGSFIFANWILFMIFKGSLYEVKTSLTHSALLLGDDNAIIYVIFPGILCLACNSIMKYGKISWFVWFEILISEYTLLKVWSASALVAFTLFIVLFFYTMKAGRINPKLLMVGIVIAIFIVLFGLQNAYVQRFINDVLHKDVTLTHRVDLWTQAFEMIMKRPVLGYGGYFQEGRFRIVNAVYPSHTPYLQMLIDGGIILLAVFILITYFGFSKVSKYKTNGCGQVLAIGLACIMINYITEYSQLYHYIIIICLMLNIEYLNGELKNKINLKTK